MPGQSKASTKSKAEASKPKKEYKKIFGEKHTKPRILGYWEYLLWTTLFPLGIVLFCIGGAGLMVLMDQDQTGYLSNTWFGEKWRQLIEINPMFSAATFNGGMIMAFFSFVHLYNHKLGLEEQEEEQPGKEKKEEKKDK